jgi:hypothetical protein
MNVLSHSEEAAQRSYLQRYGADYANLCANGKLFTGIKRPKGFRQMTPKQCFANSQLLAVIRKQGTYVEGLCLVSSLGVCVAHGWLTLDGQHAIDVTLPDAENNAYFGIAFDNHQVSQFILTHKCWGSLLKLTNFTAPFPPQLAEAVRQ